MRRVRQDWQQALNSLEAWAIDKGYHVAFSDQDSLVRDNCICSVSKIIDIDGTLPAETQVYYLLHECGHVLIFENSNYYNRKNAAIKNETNQEYKVLTVLEEAEAWKRGYALAKRLLIPITKKRWNNETITALNKYILWAAGLDWEKEINDENKNSR